MLSNKLINENVKAATLYLVLLKKLELMMRDARTYDPPWDYRYVKNVYYEIKGGTITPRRGMQKIWGWYRQWGEGSSFPAVDFKMLANKYGVKLD